MNNRVLICVVWSSGKMYYGLWKIFQPPMRLRLFESMCDKIDLNFIADAGNMWWPLIALKWAKEAEHILSFRSGWRVTFSLFREKTMIEDPDWENSSSIVKLFRKMFYHNTSWSFYLRLFYMNIWKEEMSNIKVQEAPRV